MNGEIKHFFSLIKKKLPDNISLVEEIASVLDINYDAAYRRINEKTELSFKEVICLAKFYKISLNSIYSFGDEESILVKKKTNRQTFKSLESFFEKSTKLIDLFSKLKKSEILYAAKDIPIYYLPEGGLLQKFKIFTLLNLPFTGENNNEKLDFENFIIPPDLKYEIVCFKNAFRKINCTEIWNNSTIDSSLYKIYFCYKIKLITKSQTTSLFNEFKMLIEKIEHQAQNEKWETENNKTYKMYYNKLVCLDNTILFKSENLKSLLIPYIPISYLRIDDEKTCDETAAFFNKRIQLSKKISGNTEIDRKLFFSYIYEKLDQFYNQIENEDIVLTL